MSRDVLIPVLLLALLFTAPVAAADKPSGDNRAAPGLSCVSIAPPKDGGPSCDKLCAAQHAACVGLTLNGSINPGIGCADAIDALKGDAVAGCRCCTVGH
jgi:hypothetical protein